MPDAAEAIIDELILGSARGRKSKPVALAYERDLTLDDLRQMQSEPNGTSVMVPRVRMRHQHHLAARLLAEGTRPGEVAAIVGYELATVSILQNDPAFRELVSTYKAQVSDAYTTVHERLALVGGMALELMQDKLQREQEIVDAGGEGSLSMKTLQETMSEVFDRSIAPTKSAAKNNAPAAAPAVMVNVSFGTSDGSGAKVIEAQAIPVEETSR